MAYRDIAENMLSIMKGDGTLPKRFQACIELNPSIFKSILDNLTLAQRTKDITLMVASGKTLNEVGDAYSMTGTRVGQLLRQAEYYFTKEAIKYLNVPERQHVSTHTL